jgi:hypothetical protein
MIALFILFLTLYVFSASGHFYSTDEVLVYSTTKAIAEQGSLNISNELNYFRHIGIAINTQEYPENATRAYSYFGLLQPILAVPFYYLAIGLHVNTMRFVSLTYSPVLSAVGVCIVFSILRRIGSSTKVATITTILYGLCSIAWPYAKFSFDVTTASVTLLAATFFLMDPSPRYDSTFLAGLFGAFTLFARTTQAVMIPGMLLYVLSKRATLSRRVSNFVIFLIPCIVESLVYFELNIVRFGSAMSYQPLGNGGGFNLFSAMYSSNPLVGIYGMLLSSGEGLFIYYPLCALGLAVLCFFNWPKRSTSFLFGWYFFSTLVYFSRLWFWHGWGAWGARYLVVASPYLIMSCAMFVEHTQESLSKKILIVGLATIGVFSNLMGVLVNFLYDQEYLAGLGAFSNFPYPGIWIPNFSPLRASWDLLWSDIYPVVLYPPSIPGYVYFLNSRFDLYFYTVFGMPALIIFSGISIATSLWLFNCLRLNDVKPALRPRSSART